MEYIKKEELIEGEIYKANNESLTFIMKATKDLNNVINIPSYNEFMKSGNFNGSYLTFINATSEEKHWLNTCIQADKFISYEEAMKTFIPEYVEWVDNIGSENLGYQTIDTFKKNKIFKTDIELPSAGFQKQNWKSHLEIYPNNYIKSTKEAYDAQFVVKEPEFVLPNNWCIKVTEENRSLINKLRRKKSIGCKNPIKYDYLSSNDFSGTSFVLGTEITFEQFKKYVLKEEIVEEKVIKPLPQFKVIETIETITKVENNEGNQFFIGDVVKSSPLNIIHKITGFKYDINKTTILALTDKVPTIGVGINKLEHYIEPKVEIKDEFILPEKWFIKRNAENDKIVIDYINKIASMPHSYLPNNIYNPYLHNNTAGCCSDYNVRENYTEITFDQFKKYVLKEEDKTETLLDKAKRLYPIDTKIISLLGRNAIIKTNYIYESLSPDGYKHIYADNGNYQIYCARTNRWAKIIK